jgi:uncharacterized protein YehS (DUF1456 family)
MKRLFEKEFKGFTGRKMELLMVNIKCKYRYVIDEGVVNVEGEIFTVSDPKENVSKEDVMKLFKERQKEDMEKWNENVMTDIIDYGLSIKRREYEYYETYCMLELPIDREIVIKKWKFKMEIKVVDNDDDGADYLDIVADYHDTIYNPEIIIE